METYKPSPNGRFMAVYLKRVLVTGMIDAFCELIASLNFPWLVCLFLGFSFPLFLPWKPNKTKGKQGNQRKTIESTQPQTKENQRKPKEIKGNQRKTVEESTQPQTRENQRTSKETNGNRRKRKQIKGYPAVKDARSSDVAKALL